MYQVIALLNQTKNKLISKNLFVAGLTSFIGLRSLYVNGKVIPSIYRLILLAIIGSIFYFGFLAFSDPINNAGNIPTTTNQEIDPIKNSGIGLMVCALLFYVIHIGLGLYKVFQLKKQKEENQESIILFENYVEEIK